MKQSRAAGLGCGIRPGLRGKGGVGYMYVKWEMKMVKVRKERKVVYWMRWRESKTGFKGFVFICKSVFLSTQIQIIHNPTTKVNPSAPPLSISLHQLNQKARHPDGSTPSSSACSSPTPPPPTRAQSPTPCTRQTAAHDAACCTG